MEEGNHHPLHEGWMKKQEEGLVSSIVKFFDKPLLDELEARMNVEMGDLLFFAAGSESLVNQGLDHLRRLLAKERNLIDPNALKFLWVVDFPLFDWDEQTKRLQSTHHPFTSPHFEDLDILDSNPRKARAIAYDIIINGYEVGGGSQRIHDYKIQQKIFELLQLSKEDIKNKFGFFTEALQYGTPPHLGIAFGLDRIMMILTKTENIRDVIAFPKTQKASDLMMQCPSTVSEEQLQELEIRTKPKEIPWL